MKNSMTTAAPIAPLFHQLTATKANSKNAVFTALRMGIAHSFVATVWQTLERKNIFVLAASYHSQSQLLKDANQSSD
jgi:hypothetical protein